MSGDVTPYTGKITSEHQGAPRFMASVAASVQPFADALASLQGMSEDFDLDFAVGAQLDVLGQWIGVFRYLQTPLNNVFFSFDTAGLGFDQGAWFGPFDSGTQMTRLPDDIYRIVLLATVLANQWDGTVGQAYAAYAVLFSQFPEVKILLQDNQDMTIELIMIATFGVTAITQALFTSGLLSLRPAGVLETFTIITGPTFAFDSDTPTFAGFDEGSWATFV